MAEVFQLPAAALLRSVKFNQACAKKLVGWGLSANAIANHMALLIGAFVHEDGRLKDETGRVLAERETCPEAAFGNDPGGYLCDYLKRADKPGVKLLHNRLVRRAQFFALALHLDARAKGLSEPDFNAMALTGA